MSCLEQFAVIQILEIILVLSKITCSNLGTNFIIFNNLRSMVVCLINRIRTYYYQYSNVSLLMSDKKSNLESLLIRQNLFVGVVYLRKHY